MGRKGIQIQTLDEVNGATQTYATHTGSSSELTCVGGTIFLDVLTA